jgi:HEXXH motif-containing protein
MLSLSTRLAVATALLEQRSCDVHVTLGSGGRGRIPVDGRILQGPAGSRVRVRVIDGALQSFAQPAKLAGPFEVVDGDAEAGKLPVVRPLSGGSINPEVRHLAAGAATLAITSPALLEEAAALSPVLVGVSGQTDTSHSASLEGARGCVWLTPVKRPLVVAETLVHETSHLKYFLAEDLSRFSDPSDPPRLSVPWRTDLRPLRAVLMGVHAWTRVIVWLRSIEEETLRARASQRLAILEPAVTEGLSILAETEGLTAEGQQLVSALGTLAFRERGQ